jgi:hypothetical protein
MGGGAAGGGLVDRLKPSRGLRDVRRCRRRGAFVGLVVADSISFESSQTGRETILILVYCSDWTSRLGRRVIVLMKVFTRYLDLSNVCGTASSSPAA